MRPLTHRGGNGVGRGLCAPSLSHNLGGRFGGGLQGFKRGGCLAPGGWGAACREGCGCSSALAASQLGPAPTSCLAHVSKRLLHALRGGGGGGVVFAAGGCEGLQAGGWHTVAPPGGRAVSRGGLHTKWELTETLRTRVVLVADLLAHAHLGVCFSECCGLAAGREEQMAVEGRERKSEW